jgi:hypothetical protein
MPRPTEVLGNIYDGCWKATVEVHALWDVYRTLFLASEREVAILNHGAGFAAWAFQVALLDHILLCICRVTDPAATGSKSNLTLESLLEILPAEFTVAERDALAKLKDEIGAAVEPLRLHRNKRIAHSDLAHACAKFADLPPILKTHIEDAIALIERFVTTVSLHFGEDQIFELPGAVEGAQNLLLELRFACETERIGLGLRTGRLTPEEAAAALLTECNL